MTPTYLVGVSHLGFDPGTNGEGLPEHWDILISLQQGMSTVTSCAAAPRSPSHPCLHTEAGFCERCSGTNEGDIVSQGASPRQRFAIPVVLFAFVAEVLDISQKGL